MAAKAQAKAQPKAQADAIIVPLLPEGTSDETKAAATDFVAVVRSVVGAFAVVGEQTLLAARALLVVRGTFTLKDKADYGGRSPEYHAAYRAIMAAAIPDEDQRGKVGAAIRKRIDEAAKANAERGWEKITLPPKRSSGTGDKAGSVKAPTAKAVNVAAQTLLAMAETKSVTGETDQDKFNVMVPLSSALSSVRMAEGMLAEKEGADAGVKDRALLIAEIACSIVRLTGGTKQLQRVLANAEARSIAKRNEAQEKE